ncbi:MAG: hypothetical protein HY829_14210, partial [Actinobacteria bacterium]|nr:hypothetical protein [Actinomycetota bacterium]
MRRILLGVVMTSTALAVLCLVAPLAATLTSALFVLWLAPLGRSITGRVGAMLLIWMSMSQFAYLVAWPVSFPPRQAVAWTLAAVAAVVWRAVKGPGPRPPQLLVRQGPPMVALLAFAGTVVWWFWPWRGDAGHVLNRMLLGWDSSGHFAIVEQLRAPQVAADSSFPGYPRGYHSLVASLMELGSGSPAGLDSELVAYAYAALVVMGASLVLLAAFVLDSPVVRRRPVLLPLVVAALVTLLLQLDDAAQVPYLGFGNFLEAVGFAGAGVLVALAWTRRADAWSWFLWGCAVAGVVGAWPLLVVFLAPVPLGVWLARRRFEKTALARMVSRAGAALVPLVLAALAQPPVTRVVASAAQPTAGPLTALDRFLLLDGAIGTSSLGWPMVFPLAGIAVPLGLALYGRRSPASLRIAWLWLPAAAAMVTAFAMLGYEIARVGSLRYYGIKALCAAVLVAGPVAIVTSASAVDGLLLRRLRPVAVTVATAVLTVTLLLCDGGPVRLGPLQASPGGAERAYTASAGPEQRQRLSDAVRASCTAIAGRPGEYYLLVAGAAHDDLVRANVWLITCGLDWGS